MESEFKEMGNILRVTTKKLDYRESGVFAVNSDEYLSYFNINGKEYRENGLYIPNPNNDIKIPSSAFVDYSYSRKIVYAVTLGFNYTNKENFVYETMENILKSCRNHGIRKINLPIIGDLEQVENPFEQMIDSFIKNGGFMKNITIYLDGSYTKLDRALDFFD